ELALLLQRGERRDADQVALTNHAEALGLEHDVERLIPRHVLHADGDVALNVVRRDDVDASDVREESEDVVDVRVLEIEVDAAAVVATRGLRVERRGEAGSLAAGRDVDLGLFTRNRRLDLRYGVLAR